MIAPTVESGVEKFLNQVEDWFVPPASNPHHQDYLEPPPKKLKLTPTDSKKREREADMYTLENVKRRKPNRSEVNQMRNRIKAKLAQGSAKAAGRSTHVQSHSTIHSSRHTVLRKRSVRRRRRTKKVPLRRRVGRVERLLKNSVGQVRAVTLYNGVAPTALPGFTNAPSDSDAGLMILHPPAAIYGGGAWSAAVSTVNTTSTALAVVASSDTGGKVLAASLPLLEYWEPDHDVAISGDPLTSMGLVKRNPIADTISQSVNNPNQNFVHSIDTYIVCEYYNGHGYPVHIQFNECTVKNRIAEVSPLTCAITSISDTVTDIDTHSLVAKGYQMPDRNPFKLPAVKKHYNVKTTQYEIPAGGILTVRFKAHSGTLNRKKYEEERGTATVTSPLATKNLGTKYIYIRVWGATGIRTLEDGTANGSGGTYLMPVNRVHVGMRAYFKCKYPTGGHQHIPMTERYVDNRDGGTTAATSLATLGETVTKINEDSGT